VELRTHFDGTSIRFNVYNITHDNLLLQYGLVDSGVETQLLRSLDRLQADNNVRDGFPIPAQWVFSFCWGQLRDFSFIDLLSFLYPKT
jgi:hypothetical protein